MLLRRLREYARFLKSFLKTGIRLLWGMWKLTKLPQPAITIFGSAKVLSSNEICQQARRLAKALAGADFSIITGGGPGIMNAANQGAIDHLKEKHLEEFLQGKEIITAGVGLIRLTKETENPFVQEHIEMEHFFARKWLLIRYSVGFVIFPGGFGTMDELFEIITLVQCNRMARVPIILIGKSYWGPFIEWIEHYTLKEGFIMPHDLSIITIVDQIEQAVEIIMKECKGLTQSTLHNESGSHE
ncbi:TIGR00730 family Rossman fold protein [Candidatus Babeliales bacterium]|nr:TIGR00730 family Rossman fold protein [Candidatus Babeliales bacterium]